MFILTDIELRARWFREHEKEYMLPDDPVIITPAARDFIKEHEITLIGKDHEQVKWPGDSDDICVLSCREYKGQALSSDGDMSIGVSKDVSAADRKPEDMTHLNGHVLVHKSHPRIAFRGKLDSIEAGILKLQVTAREDGQRELEDQLEEILKYVKEILKAEVMDLPLPQIYLLGLDSDGLRYETHHVKELYGFGHPTPDHSMGRICMELNDLRAQVREGELAAVSAFKDDGESRIDIIQAMNRLSSAIYILFLRQLKMVKDRCGSNTLCTEQVDIYGKPDAQSAASGTCTVGGRKMLPGIMVEASGRHVHLNESALKALFGGPLHEKSPLSQPGQYASQERVKLVTSKGEIDNVIVLGPTRDEVQVEMSLTDARILGINIPVNMSGDLKGAGDVILVGPEGIYNAPGSAIAARAHIHMTPADAAAYEVEDGDSVSVRIETERPVTISEVIVRVSEKFALAMHIDYDEANACLFKKGDLGYIIK